MFRTFFFALLSISCVANAGLDIGLSDDIIAIYDFEVDTFESDERGSYAESSGPHEMHGYFHPPDPFEFFSDDGKFGQCMVLSDNTKMRAYTERPPQIGGTFSIVAWIKMQRQPSGTSIHLSLSGISFGIAPHSRIMLTVTSSGNIAIAQDYIPDPGVIGISFYRLLTEDQNVVDNEWHHIAVSRHAHTYRLFIDGELVKSDFTSAPRFTGEFTSFKIGSISTENLIGEVFIDNVGVFRTGFSVYEMRGLYEDGLTKFLETMSVNPQGRLATTWGQLKSNQ